MHRWTVLLLVIAFAGWGIAAFVAEGSAPILVTVASADGSMQQPSPVVPGSAAREAFTEVVVARSRPVAAEVTDMPVAGVPGARAQTISQADPDFVAAEVEQLRAALDSWLAVPSRDLRIEQSWVSVELSSMFVLMPKRVRVVLHARLSPVSTPED